MEKVLEFWNFCSKILSTILPFVVLYLLSAFILGNWNILLYSDIEKVIIALAALWNVPAAIYALKGNADLISILIGATVWGIYCYLGCAFLSNTLDMKSFFIGDKIVAAIVVEVMTMFFYLTCKKDVSV